MGTREDCKNDHHTVDNQGLCYWCGKLLEPDWWEAYAGEPHPDLEKNDECEEKKTLGDRRPLGG